MSVITDIKIKSKTKELAQVYIDGKFFADVSWEVLVKSGLKKGVEISEAMIAEITGDTTLQAAFNQALKYVSMRAKTQAEVKKYLLGKKYEMPAVDYAINKLKTYKYIDDAEYAQSYVQMYKDAAGVNKIAFNLQRRGIDSQIIRNALNSIEDQSEAIASAAEKYMKGKPYDYKTKNKLYGFLTRRGFKYSEISSVINKFDFKGGDNEDRY